MDAFIAFVVGIFVGGLLGMFITILAISAGQHSKKEEKDWWDQK